MVQNCTNLKFLIKMSDDVFSFPPLSTICGEKVTKENKKMK